MTVYADLLSRLKMEPRTWLVTGVAGFIGSNLLETLLKSNQRVVGLDNFATGHYHNLAEVQSLVTPRQWSNFRFIEGDIRNLEDCRRALTFSSPTARDRPANLEEKTGAVIPVDYVLHQAAIGSVQFSIEDPITSNANNIDGFLNMLVAARDAGARRFVYAASSSTYGDDPDLPKVEGKIGKPLSPYAITKLVNELYADVFASAYNFRVIGLRYFNIFGLRQHRDGAYAAVIPKWISAMIRNEPVYINGDGETSRDFCYVDNAVQANLLAATVEESAATNQIYNIAVGDRTTLNDLFRHLRDSLVNRFPHLKNAQPIYRAFRAGDVRHSQADISKAEGLLGYSPTHRIENGLKEAMIWYVKNLESNQAHS